jgi:hypothetical protein
MIDWVLFAAAMCCFAITGIKTFDILVERRKKKEMKE